MIRSGFIDFSVFSIVLMFFFKDKFTYTNNTLKFYLELNNYSVEHAH